MGDATQRWRTLLDRSGHMVTVVIALALFLRVAFVFTLPDGILWPDGNRYERIAINLVEGRGFGSLEDNSHTVPTQPLFMALVHLLFGRGLLPLRIATAALGALTCGLSFLLVRRMFGPVPAAITSAILIVYPYYVYISALFEYPTTLFILLIEVGFLLLLAPDLTRDRRLQLAAGILLGLSALTVPAAITFLPLAIVGAPLARRVRGKRALVISLTLLAGVSVPMGAWSVRNYLAYDRLILVNSAGPESLWKGNNPFFAKYRDADVIAKILKYGEADDEMLADWNAMPVVSQTKDLPVREAGPLYLDAALEFILGNPGTFLKLTATKFLNYWRLYPKTIHTNVHTNRLTNLVGALSYGPLLALAVWGAVLSRKRWRELALVYGYILSLSATYSVLHPSVRYRLPLDLFLSAFAALAISTWLRSRLRRSPNPQLDAT